MRFARLRVALDFRDAWIGLFWDVQPKLDQFVISEQKLGDMTIERMVHPRYLHVYVCPLPFVAVHFEFSLGVPGLEAP